MGEQCSRFHPPKESTFVAPSQEPIALPVPSVHSALPPPLNTTPQAASSKNYLETLVPLERPVATIPVVMEPPNKVATVPPAKKSGKTRPVLEECKDNIKSKSSKAASCQRIQPATEIKEAGIVPPLPSKIQCASTPSKKTPKTLDTLVTPNESSAASANATDAMSASVPVSSFIFKILKRL